jgi:hypothetical protein
MNYGPQDTKDMDRMTDIHAMTSGDFAVFGNGEIAYIRQVSLNGEDAFAVHSADGLTLAVINDRDLAVAVVRQNELEPLSLH